MSIALVRRDRDGAFSFTDPTGRHHDGITTIQELLELFDALPGWGETVKVVLDKPRTCVVCGGLIPLRRDGSEKSGETCSKSCGTVRWKHPDVITGPGEYANVDRKPGRGQFPSLNID